MVFMGGQEIDEAWFAQEPMPEAIVWTDDEKEAYWRDLESLRAVLAAERAGDAHEMDVRARTRYLR